VSKFSKLVGCLMAICSASAFAAGAVNKLVVLGSTSDAGVVTVIEKQPIPEAFVDLNAPMHWCNWRNEDSLSFENDENDVYGFMLKKGTLVKNIERLIESFYPESQGLVNRIGRHLVPGTTCLVSVSPERLIQKMIEPYYVGSQEVIFGTFTNNFEALFYKNDREFAKYLVGAKR
jgi:hypothetical protein